MHDGLDDCVLGWSSLLAGGGQCGGGIVDEHSVCVTGRGLAMLMLLRKQVVC